MNHSIIFGLGLMLMSAPWLGVTLWKLHKNWIKSLHDRLWSDGVNTILIGRVEERHMRRPCSECETIAALRPELLLRVEITDEMIQREFFDV